MLSEGNLREMVILQNLWIWISTGILSGKDLNLVRSQTTVLKPSSSSKSVWRLGFVTYQDHFSAANMQWYESCSVRSCPLDGLCAVKFASKQFNRKTDYASLEAHSVWFFLLLNVTCILVFVVVTVLDKTAGETHR